MCSLLQCQFLHFSMCHTCRHIINLKKGLIQSPTYTHRVKRRQMKIYILRFTCTYEGKKLGGGEGSRWIVLRFFYLLNSVLIAFCFSIFVIYLKNLLVKDTLRKLSKGKNYIRTLWKVIQIVIRVYLKTHLKKFIIPNFHYQECHI